MLYQHTSRHGERLSTNAAFIRPIRRKRKNLTIRTQAHVTRVLIDPRTKHAFGVEYIRDGEAKITTVRTRKEVIVSAGTINSPKVLLLSGVGPKDQLVHFGIHVIQDLRVGENLQDHVTLSGVIIALNKTATTANDDQRLHDVQKYEHSRKGPLSSTGPLQVGVFTVTEYSEHKDVPDIQYSFDAATVKDFITNPTLEPNVQPLAYYDALNTRPIVLRPRSRGRILLNTTDPIWGAPLIYPNYFGDPRDLETLVAGKYILTTDIFTVRWGGANLTFGVEHTCTGSVHGTALFLIRLNLIQLRRVLLISTEVRFIFSFSYSRLPFASLAGKQPMREGLIPLSHSEIY